MYGFTCRKLSLSSTLRPKRPWPSSPAPSENPDDSVPRMLLHQASKCYLQCMRPQIEQAIALLRNGDEQAVEQALHLLQQTVFSFSMRVCGQREDAEDTMQEVLLKSVPYLPKFESPKALLVWIYKVAKNRCLMNRRRSKFAPKDELSLEDLMPDRRELQNLHAD